MAANMAQMGGGGPNRFRQPGQNPAVAVYNQLATQQIPQGTWHSQVQINQRVSHIINLTTNTSLAVGGDSTQALNSALSFERDAFHNSPDKITYEKRIASRVQELFQKRQADASTMHQTLNAQAAAQQQAQNQQIMMNQMRGIGQPPQGFGNLQQQMPNNQMPHGQPGMLMNGANGMAMFNQPGLQMGGQMRQQVLMTGPFAGLPPQDIMKIKQLAMSKVAQAPEHNRNQMRAIAQQKIPPQILTQCVQENVDPLVYLYMQNIVMQTRNQNGMNQGGMGMPGQPQRPMNQAMQQFPGQPNPDFSFAESIMNQQKAGMMAQQEGQMVVPASNGAPRNATPQPMGSLQGPGQGPGRPLSQQFGQTPNQSDMDRQAAETQAQIRAKAQANMQMGGQPNNVNPQRGVSQSPAMNTLNAPRPPMGIGQNDGNPQMGGPFAPQMLNPQFNQMGQQRPFMGPNGGNSNMTQQQAFKIMLSQMKPEARQRMQQLPSDKLIEVISRWASNKGITLQVNAQQQPQNGQMTPGNPMNSMGRGNMMGQQPNMGGFPMNQQPNNPLMQQFANNMNNNNRMQNLNMPQGGAPTQQALMDSMPIPAKVLENLRNMMPQMPPPPEVKKWIHLKQWASQKNLAPHILTSLLGVQSKQFATLVANNSTPAQMQPQQGQGQGLQPTPPQQITQNGVQPPPQPGLATLNAPGPTMNIEITPQELQNAKRNPRFKDWPDQKICEVLVHVKSQSLRRANQMAGQMAGPQPPVLQAPQPTGMAAANNQQPPNAINGLQRQQPNMPAEASAANPATAGRNNKAPTNARPAPNSNTPAQQKTGTKRPSTDESVVEVPNPSRTPVQRPSSQQPPAHPATANVPRPIPQLNPQQLAAMHPDQRAKYEAMVKAQQQQQQQQQAQQSQTPEMIRLRQIGAEAHNASTQEILPEVSMTRDELEDMKQKVRSMSNEMSKLSKILGRWYTFTHDDDRARSFFKMRLLLLKQFVDNDMIIPKDSLTITMDHLNQMKGLLESMAKDLAKMYPAGMKRNPSQQNPSEATPASAPAAGQTGNAVATVSQPVPLSAANLEKQTQALNQAHLKKNSRANHQQPPAAPTTSQPPIQFGAQSPSGQPTYAGRPTVTQESLQLPARKKAKLGAPAGSGSNASPQLQKLSSPEISKRPSSTDMKQAPPKPQFMCTYSDCEFANIGFTTEEILRKHVDDEHIKPYEDPEKFFNDSLAFALKKHQEYYEAKHGKNGQSPGDATKQSQTPPVSRDSPMGRQNSSAGKPNELLKTVAGKTGTSKAAENAAGPGGMSSSNNDTFFGAQNTVDPQDLFHPLGLDIGGGGAISDMSVYRSITPNDTPESSSKDSLASDPVSDLSDGVALNVTLDMGFDTWDPFCGEGPWFDAEKANADLGDTDNMPSGSLGETFSWDDVKIDFDKPFVLDMSQWSFDTTKC